MIKRGELFIRKEELSGRAQGKVALLDAWSLWQRRLLWKVVMVERNYLMYDADPK